MIPNELVAFRQEKKSQREVPEGIVPNRPKPFLARTERHTLSISSNHIYLLCIPIDALKMSPHIPKLRSLYRRILRELPSRSHNQPHGQSLLSNPSPLQRRIRSSFSSAAADTNANATIPRIQETEQFIKYIQAQRQYVTLVERYNPGMNMTEEERVRLSARRVGMNLPVEVDFAKGKR
jgi:ATP synthase assembly factor FMC1, mitochondrial